jgi:phage shock protein A
MGQLFNRISRVVRSELNSSKSEYRERYLDEGTALVAGGVVTGASIGKVGVLAGGTGYSLGAVPLAAAGALTGAALYEALRSFIEADTSSTSAAVIGAATGAATSAAIGGVGVAVGGSAIGVGMASMAAGGAVVGLGLAGLNRLFQQGIDPEKLLDSAIEQMESNLRNARKAVVDVIASQKRLQQHYEQTQAEVNKWEQRSKLALQKGDEYLAQEALSRKKTYSGILSSLKGQLDQEPASVKNLKQSLTLLEAKLSEAKTLRTSLKARIAAAKANGQLQGTVSNLGASSPKSASEIMELKVLQMEVSSQAATESPFADLDTEFTRIKSFGNVDEELAELKALLQDSNHQAQSQPISSEPLNTLRGCAAVDAELEELKRILDQP